jgi:phage gpG-like protein
MTETTLGVADLLDAARYSESARRIVEPLLKRISIVAISGVKEHFAQSVSPEGIPWLPLAKPRIDGSSKPLRDQGRLMGSIIARVETDRLLLQSNSPSAPVHQFGATIRPKTGHALTIPLTAEAKRVGSPRQNHFPRPLFVYTNHDSGHAFLAESQGGKLVLNYLLVKESVIPARPFLGYSQRTLEKIEKMIADQCVSLVLAIFGDKGAVRE